MVEINLGQKIIRKYYAKNIIVLIFSALIILASLYQLEIILIRVTQDRTTFEFPFFLMTMNIWLARDIWYLFMFFGWALGAYSGFKLGEVRDFEALVEDPEKVSIIKEIIQIDKETKDDDIE